MAEAAFSEDGKYYSAITQDGRLRIWDTETNVLKQEYTPDLHLTSPPSCLQWISITQSTGSQQKSSKRKSSTSEETHCIALGTTSGKILIYSISQAKIETVLSDESNNNITALDWHKKYGLYSCNKENYVNEWDLTSSAVRYKYNVSFDKRKQGSNVSAIKIVPHKQSTQARYLVVASYQVRVFRLLDGDATVVQNLGHNAAPSALLNIATLNDVCWLVEGSQNERLISFFDVTITEQHLPQLNGDEPTPTPTKRQRKKSLTKPPTTVPTATPTYNFVLEDAPRIIDVDMRVEDGATRLSLAAATRSGVVHYYGHMLNGSSTKPIKPSVTVQMSTAGARPLPLQCCRLPRAGDLLLGYQDGPVLLFERVVPDLKSKTQLIIRGEATEKEGKKKHSQQKQKNDVNKVRSDDAPAHVNYAQPLGGARKRATPGAQDTVEVPMESRLANLSLGAARGAVCHNMTRLLVQGLHSRDQGIIRTVLQTDDASTALRTVSSLPADHVPQLLEQLADMATKKTSQCACVCTWLGALLRCHAALLLATLSSPTADHLTQLLAIFTSRRSHLCQLLNLKGRLELTVAQRGAGADLLHDQDPIIDYNDTSSDEEMEADQYQSDSAQSWDDASGADASAPDDDDSDGGE